MEINLERNRSRLRSQSCYTLLVIIVLVCLAGTAVLKTVEEDVTSRMTVNSCEMTESEFQLAPWTVAIRRVSPSGDEQYFPGTVLDEYTVLSSFIRYVVAPGSPWTLCGGSKLSVQVTRQSKGIVEEVEVTHFSIHPQMAFHGIGNIIWTKDDYNLVLLHLRSPLVLSETRRPVCLPNMTAGEEGQAIQATLGEGQLGFMTGWANLGTRDTTISLHFRFSPANDCTHLWRLITSAIPFDDKTCGYFVSGQDRTVLNPLLNCIAFDSGVYIQEHRKRTVLVGFMLNYFRNKVNDMCDKMGHMFISTLNANAVAWIQWGMKCRASHACGNGDCIPVNQVCDGKINCPDGGDEDPRICRPRNCCVPGRELACGVQGPCIRNVTGQVANCNGFMDCPNGEDESDETCPRPQSTNEVKSSPMGEFGGIIALVIFTILGVVLVMVVFRRREKVLSQETIDEFFKGSLGGGSSAFDDENELLDIRALKYDPNYEFDGSECVLGKRLGDGQFGTVNLASLNGTTVALKTRNTKDGCVSTFIALLAELKMMLYIESQGGHPNIVRLVGAHTQNIRSLELKVAIEFCTNGDLETYLRGNRNKFRASSGRRMEQFSSFIGLETESDSEAMARLTTLDLVKWSMQIAQAMEFLLSKRIVHSDLATRNVLLDEYLNGKVCDFGLSHQLHRSSQVYTMTTRLGFPWRWAAPETLESQGRVCNLRSDIWSFGVTLWEIFSLGQIPWAEIKDEIALLSQIHNTAGNLLIPKPAQYDCTTDEIYEIMCSCWQLAPAERPSFEILTLMLQELYDQMCNTIEMDFPESSPEHLCSENSEVTQLPLAGTFNFNQTEETDPKLATGALADSIPQKKDAARISINDTSVPLRLGYDLPVNYFYEFSMDDSK